MTRLITYSLRPDTSSSDEYHHTISTFADTWLSNSTLQLHDLLDGFRQYCSDRGKASRSDAEYAFELLALGVLLHEHGRDAARMPGWAGHWLAKLVDVQGRHPKLEKMIKRLRGWLGWVAGGLPRRGENKDLLETLLAWLGADGEISKQDRLGEWQAWFRSQGREFTRDGISRTLHLADAFAEASLPVLGKYTENVESFLAEDVSIKRRRYDARLLTRTRLEYHLGMLGTEILNRAYRPRFLETRRKMVILPPCMCAPKEECRAVETPFGAKCQACTPACQVHQITKLGEKLGFGVTMIPDDVKVFGDGRNTGSIGLVGVSCALTNWNGGWEAGAVGIPCQGLLLDYVGCKYHWDRNGIPTDTNMKRLMEIVDVCK